MAIKKYTNGSWVSSCRKYGTETDAITTLPATVIGDGTPISSYTIKGNMEQTGTPTPSNPIYPSECGERTENLWDISSWDGITAQRGTLERVSNGYKLTATSHDAYTMTYGSSAHSYRTIGGNEYTISWTVDNPQIHGIVYIFTGTSVADTVLKNVVASSGSSTFTVPSGHNYVAFRLGVSFSGTSITYTNIMLTAGSTPPPSYIPYGYKLPLTLGSTTTNIYLGEVQSERKIKKLVLTGEEDWSYEGEFERFKLAVGGMYSSGRRTTRVVCTHYQCIYDGRPVEQVPYDAMYIGDPGANVLMVIKTRTYTTVADFKAFLAQQYANGVPVTVWYVLTTTTTGIVNEPIRKIGDYVDSVSGTNLATSCTAQEFDVGTTLKPSEVDLTYHGWHEHDDTKYST